MTRWPREDFFICAPRRNFWHGWSRWEFFAMPSPPCSTRRARRQLMQGLESSLEEIDLNARRTRIAFSHPGFSRRVAENPRTHACAHSGGPRRRRLSHRRRKSICAKRMPPREMPSALNSDRIRVRRGLCETMGTFRSLHRGEFQGRISSAAGPRTALHAKSPGRSC